MAFFEKHELQANRIHNNRQPGITACVLYDNNCLIVAREKGIEGQVQIEFLELKSFQLQQKLSVGPDTINALVLLERERLLIGASSKGALIFWDISDLASPIRQKIIQAHDYVSSIIKLDQGLLSCGYDGLIKEWDLQGNLVYIYQAHTDKVNALCRIGHNRFASLSNERDPRIIIWDLETRGISASIDTSSCPSSYFMLLISPHHLVTVGGNLCFWDITKNSLEARIVEPFYSRGAGALTLLSKNIIAVGVDGGVVVVDIADRKIITEKGVCAATVSAILSLEKEYILCSHDGTITNVKSSQPFEPYKLR